MYATENLMLCNLNILFIKKKKLRDNSIRIIYLRVFYIDKKHPRIIRTFVERRYVSSNEGKWKNSIEKKNFSPIYLRGLVSHTFVRRVVK